MPTYGLRGAQSEEPRHRLDRLHSPDCAAPSVLQLVPMFRHDFSRGSRSADHEWGQHPTNILLGAAIIKWGAPKWPPNHHGLTPTLQNEMR